jgi:transcription initiation factor IIE alpha subunit
MEIKDLLDYLGVEDVKDLDAFKKSFSEKYITRAEANDDDEIKSKITGKITGSITTLAKRLFGLSSEEINGKKWEEIVELGKAKQDSLIEELKSKQGQSSDEAVKELQAKLEKANARLQEYKDNNSLLQKTLEDTKADYEGRLKTEKINNILAAEKSKVQTKLKSDLSKAEQHYLDSLIKESIKIDFDEQNEVLVLNAEGKRLANPNKAGAFLTLSEAIESIADKEGFIKKNDGGKVNPAVFTDNNQKNNGQPQGTERRVHPNALKNAEQIKSAVNR